MVSSWIPPAPADARALASVLRDAGYEQRAILDILKPEGQTLSTDRIAIRRRLPDTGG